MDGVLSDLVAVRELLHRDAAREVRVDHALLDGPVPLAWLLEAHWAERRPIAVL